MSSHYPDRSYSIPVILEVARQTACETDVEHPEDIAAAMVYAIEAAARTLQVIHERAQ
jgi:hypothetical protein